MCTLSFRVTISSFFPSSSRKLRESGTVPDYELPDPLARPAPDLCKWDSSFSTHWVSLLPKMTSTCWSSTWASSPAAGDTKKQRRVLGCHELGMLEARRLTPRRNNRKERKTHHFLLLIHLVSILFTKYQPGRVSHEFTRNEVNQDESTPPPSRLVFFGIPNVFFRNPAQAFVCQQY